MAARPYTYADAPIKPTLWMDAQDAATIGLDGDGRVITWLSKDAAATPLFTPSNDVGKRPLYVPKGIAGVYPSLQYSFARRDLMMSTTWQGPARGPCTVIHVWQEPADGQNPYACVADYRASGGGDGGRISVFNFYAATTAMSVFNGGTAALRMGMPNAYLRINVLIMEYNGENTRAYLNGVEYAFPTQVPSNSTIFGAGVCVGGKFSETYSLFNGQFGLFVVFPGAFAGDAWARLTQGTMWNWGQQALIADGSTYKNVPPTVEIVATAPESASIPITSTSPALVSKVQLVAASATLSTSASVPELSARSAIAPQSANMPTVASVPGLSFRVQLAPESAVMGVSASAAGLVPGYGLSVSGASVPVAASIASIVNARSQIAPASATMSVAIASTVLLNPRSILAVEGATIPIAADYADMRVSMKWPTPALPGMKATLIIPPRFATLTIGK